RCPIDMLPERSAASLEQWLQAHPGVEVIARDRGPEYIRGATAGAPQATQAAPSALAHHPSASAARGRRTAPAGCLLTVDLKRNTVVPLAQDFTTFLREHQAIASFRMHLHGKVRAEQKATAEPFQQGSDAGQVTPSLHHFPTRM